MTPEQRVLRARLAANTRWANTDDRRAATAAARSAFNDRWERQVDPGQQLDPAERAKRAGYAKTAHFASMALKSSISRARGKR
jgi:hypothetical protein